jgi:hypothetical protein
MPLANVVLAVGVGVEVYLAGGSEGCGEGEEDSGGELHVCKSLKKGFFVFSGRRKDQVWD